MGRTLPVTVTLQKIIEKSFPEEYAQRRAEALALEEHHKADGPETPLPLFVMSCMMPGRFSPSGSGQPSLARTLHTQAGQSCCLIPVPCCVSGRCKVGSVVSPLESETVATARVAACLPDVNFVFSAIVQSISHSTAHQ